jgi:hypothetical protein
VNPSFPLKKDKGLLHRGTAQTELLRKDTEIENTLRSQLEPDDLLLDEIIDMVRFHHLLPFSRLVGSARQRDGNHRRKQKISQIQITVRQNPNRIQRGFIFNSAFCQAFLTAFFAGLLGEVIETMNSVPVGGRIGNLGLCVKGKDASQERTITDPILSSTEEKGR